MGHPLGLTALGIVFVVSSMLAYRASLAYKRTGNPALQYLLLAFVVFILKSGFLLVFTGLHLLSSATLEVVSALFDVAIILLIAAPLLRRSKVQPRRK